jgi:hypothetical protein
VLGGFLTAEGASTAARHSGQYKIKVTDASTGIPLGSSYAYRIWMYKSAKEQLKFREYGE